MTDREAAAALQHCQQLLQNGMEHEALYILRGSPHYLELPKAAALYTSLLFIAGERDELELFLMNRLLNGQCDRLTVSYIVYLYRGLVPPASKAGAAADDVARTGHPAHHYRAAVVLLASGSVQAAFDHARDAVTKASNGSEEYRLALAQFFDWSGNRDLADEITLMAKTFGHPVEPLWHLAQLWKPTRLNATTENLLRCISTEPNPFRNEARLQYFDYLWLSEGPRASLLELSSAWHAEGASNRFLLERVCLALELGDLGSAHEMLTRVPALLNWAKAIPPLAHFVLGTPDLLRRTAGTDEIQAMGDFHLSLLAYQEEFRTTLAQPKIRTAVVGNSSSGTGENIGAEVDSHDVIIRFNKGGTTGSPAACTERKSHTMFSRSG